MMPETLYDSKNEHDSCGVGLVAHIHGRRSREIVKMGLQILVNMMHRGAESADNKTGDGAGITVQIPHDFLTEQGISLPQPGNYGTGLFFFPREAKEWKHYHSVMQRVFLKKGLTIFAERMVPVHRECLGEISRQSEPHIRQVFVAANDRELTPEKLEHELYISRNIVENVFGNQVHFASLSTRNMVYKGMLTSDQLEQYYPDLTAPAFTSAIAMVHSRFSTNTFPSWALAQPFRLLAHNGEINTIRGNRFRMESRGIPLQPNQSDSGSLDQALEHFVRSGFSLHHALSMMIPESWNDKNPISDELKKFYEYHSIFMEPWDGPAAITFTDGRLCGGMLDRNGLRPLRYHVTNDDLLVLASETGVLPEEGLVFREKGRIRPGKMILLDTETGTLQYDAEIKKKLADTAPYGEWLRKHDIDFDTIKSGRNEPIGLKENYAPLLKTFGYTRDDIRQTILPMCREGKEQIGSMGVDSPLPILSNMPQRLFQYFRQTFAQVTNPPIDPIREELVMSLTSFLGSRESGRNGHQEDDAISTDEELEFTSPATFRRVMTLASETDSQASPLIKLRNPVLTNDALGRLIHLDYKNFSSEVIPILFRPQNGTGELEQALEQLKQNVDAAIEAGKNVIVLSDRKANAELTPIPSLLAVSTVHHHLIATKKRLRVDLVLETGEAREVMHFALLFGYGVNAVNPYLALAVIDELVREKQIQLDFNTAMKNYLKAIEGGLLKIMSKMGISTLRSFMGSQTFEAVGLSSDVIRKYFHGTDSKVGGISLEQIASDAAASHRDAFSILENGGGEFHVNDFGQYAYRKNKEYHVWNPENIAMLQQSTREGNRELFKEYCRKIDEKETPVYLRDLLCLKPNPHGPIPIEEVEQASEITKRFVSGAMSFGSISKEAHETIAIAMNALGGKSNTGEGGEMPERFAQNTRSAIKQIASGRFGVTTEYLVNADELQIKIAQGAKPGEGGQLPGHKVDPVIAKTRHSTPGISLISPPPHHDIYSIEDLAQLIFDLKNVNSKAEISVKLVSESGVGTIAAGVAKAKADRILISGAEGGTGASPISSIRHTGLPLEIGLAETQQTLVLNNLRGQVRLQTDGQLRTAKDILVASMLGAEEFGFATSVLIVLGCVMMRKCHMNTCPVGIATQNEELRRRFKGRADYLVNYFTFLAEEVRELLATLGFRSLEEVIGRSDFLEHKTSQEDSRTANLDFARLLARPKHEEYAIRKTISQSHQIADVLDRKLIFESKQAIETGVPVILRHKIKNTDRSVGAMLSGLIAEKYGGSGLDENTITANFHGNAGQSFGAFLINGITFRLEGDTNDYLGKGLSGGKIIVVAAKNNLLPPEKNVIAGNAILYGATRGEAYINGIAGERFGIRNSGANAVVEGVGDHGCEYMTGGRVAVLGSVGRNFAAGMSGGIAYIYDPKNEFDYFCNMEMVELSRVEHSMDRDELQNLVSGHFEETQSPLAKRLLDDWSKSVRHFIKVLPVEYKKILDHE